MNLNLSAVLKRLLSVYENEPALVVGAVDAAVLLLQALGAPIDPNTQNALDGLLLAVSAMLVRSKVVPVAKLT